MNERGRLDTRLPVAMAMECSWSASATARTISLQLVGLGRDVPSGWVGGGQLIAHTEMFSILRIL